MILGVVHTALIVREYEEAKRFYCDCLGFTVLEDSPHPSGKRWVRLGAPGRRGSEILLSRAVDDTQRASVGNQTGGRVLFFLESNDFDADYVSMRDRGVEFTEGPWDDTYGRVAVFKDLYGNRIDLVEFRNTTARLRDLLRATLFDAPVAFDVLNERREPGYRRLLIQYRGSDDDPILAYLFVPDGDGHHPAVLVHHQHNSERHLGKSEVAGLAGSALQAFGPALAKRGFVVLAPDSICFEDRRANQRGTTPGDGDIDWLQHYNAMSYRLVRGDHLMRKVLDDASIGFALLAHSSFVRRDRVGVLGHSYGGNTALFQAAIDERVAFTCSSGAACSWAQKMSDGTGLEMALVIPGFCDRYDLDDVLAAIAPRDVLVVSATDDKYSKDADGVCESAARAFRAKGAPAALEHKRYAGGHALTEERFFDIVEWVCAQGE